MTDFFAHLETLPSPSSEGAVNDGRPRFTNAADLSAFLHAGKATITLESEKTGKRFTYRVSAPKDKETGAIDRSILFVAALTGPDNTRDYSYFGNIRGTGRFEVGRKSKLKADAQSVTVFEWFYREVVTQQRMPSKLRAYHMGQCGRCGRALTVPSSILSGIGPECAKKTDGF